MSNHAEGFDTLMKSARALKLPRQFLVGAATCAYQIEGAPFCDGKGESIWDRFTKKPGAIIDGSSGDIACDHYHRMSEDIALMKQLGLSAYRFSTAWTRIIPDGSGSINQAGLDFYSRLIDELLAAHIAPFLTLYHWDLPQLLQDKGGWYNRDTAYHFANYADAVSRAFGDRVKHWTTLNEPWTFCWSGYATGEDAPGLSDGARGGLVSSHHALLGHGLAVPLIRANAPDSSVGIVFDLNVVTPATTSLSDVAASKRFEGAQNRWFLDAVFKGAYPEDMLNLCGDVLPEIENSDNQIIAAPIDYLGINIYRRSIMAEGTELPPLNFQRVSPPGNYSAVNYEIWPECVYDVLQYVHQNYAPKEIFISENGLALAHEIVTDEGEIHDPIRGKYLVDHLSQIARAAKDGIPVKGYFVWTLMDNFEWAYGYTVPFGIVHVDFETQRRRIKDSGKIFAIIAKNCSDS